MEVLDLDQEMIDRQNRFHAMVQAAMKECFGEEKHHPRSELNDEGYMYDLPGYWDDRGVIRLE